MSAEALFTAVGLAIGAVVWLVRLEGRVNSHDRELQDIKTNHAAAIETLREDLRYIRDRIDRALGVSR